MRARRSGAAGIVGYARSDISSYWLGITMAAPVLRSYSVRSTAQPRLWRDPVAGFATKRCLSTGVASQNSLVTYHGR